jgi:hypothetical protein
VEQAALNHHDEIVELEPYNASGGYVKSDPKYFLHPPLDLDQARVAGRCALVSHRFIEAQVAYAPRTATLAWFCSEKRFFSDK